MSNHGRRQTQRILVVEDEVSVRSIIVRLLTKVGFDVSSAENAEEAFGYIDDGESFDLVITDIVMPGMSGIQMSEVWKERLPDQRFLFISGYASKEFGAARKAPPKPFLPKPFTVQELNDAVRGALGV
jgi:two-component system cell cycle sensor histidine kinase/response regulator CckA